MYYTILRQCAQQLDHLVKFLDKAEAFAAEKNFEPEVFLYERLAPDMYPLLTQIHSACGYAMSGTANFTSKRPPRDGGDGRTFPEIRSQIKRTVDYMLSAQEGDFEGAESLSVRVPWRNDPVPAETYLLKVVLANVYFHTGIAYAIFRKGGVDVGKEDFIGAVYRHD